MFGIDKAVHRKYPKYWKKIKKVGQRFFQLYLSMFK
ncbi:hypothetical protein KHA80_21570 [Anaerobacillus sp. HL2]|nr:hypothetical protein KHA80_21570 [Anaerobacillus sp. HL2]